MLAYIKDTIGFHLAGSGQISDWFHVLPSWHSSEALLSLHAEGKIEAAFEM